MGNRMKTIVETIPGYRVYEYLLVLIPNEELRNKVLQVKKEFSEAYKIAGGIGKPHLALVSFTQYGMMEERIINRLRMIAMAYHPFKIEMKDFGSFPSHTIYINVTSKMPVQNLVKEVRAETQRLMKLNEDNKPHFMMEPHLTIARKLQPWQYEKGWLEYSHKHFNARFVADAMVLLRRPAGEMKYHPVQRFVFLNLPVTTKQGELFS
jgi:2'-5' RNA ligase